MVAWRDWGVRLYGGISSGSFVIFDADISCLTHCCGSHKTVEGWKRAGRLHDGMYNPVRGRCDRRTERGGWWLCLMDRGSDIDDDGGDEGWALMTINGSVSEAVEWAL